MTPQFVVHIIGQALMTAFWMAAPLLILSFIVGVAINLIQIATSMQDSVFSTVPRLASFLLGFLLLLPWMLHHLSSYATELFGDLSRYAR
ncbi:MAG TPA: flagellar biosynthetic protein FliQ [Bryobacteraceae bacterium]|nr:flagellar biosynthetic protein FliQ [Bryobacteraceae bacterium]